MSGQAFTQTGAISIDRTLNSYPQFVPTAGAASNNPSNDGQANVSLRGLGTNRTLVLLDGRRLMPADGNGSVDLNILPPTLIRSVQVLTRGASTVYGSDALAGVVNFQLDEKFSGLAFDGSASMTDRGDGEEYSVGLTAGTAFGNGRGSLIGYVGYANRSAIAQSDRKFSQYPLQYIQGLTDGRGPGKCFLASGSGATPDGIHIAFSDGAVFDSLFGSYGYSPGFLAYQAGFGVNADGSVFTIGNGAPGSVANYLGVRDPVMFNDRVYAVDNFAPDTALQMPLKRKSLFVRGNFAAADSLDLYAQVLYADYSVERQLAAAEIGIVLIPPSNPYVRSFCPTSACCWLRVPAPMRRIAISGAQVKLGPQLATNDRDVLQATAGMRGQFAGQWQLRRVCAIRPQ